MTLFFENAENWLQILTRDSEPFKFLPAKQGVSLLSPQKLYFNANWIIRAGISVLTGRS